jgi:hypothetical protein
MPAAKRSRLTRSADHWRAAARGVELPTDLIIERIMELGERMPAAIHRVIEHPGGGGETRHIMQRTAEPVMAHVRRCLTRL